MQDEPLGMVALLAVFGLVIAAVWAVSKLVDIAVDIYMRCQRERGE